MKNFPEWYENRGGMCTFQEHVPGILQHRERHISWPVLAVGVVKMMIPRVMKMFIWIENIESSAPWRTESSMVDSAYHLQYVVNIYNRNCRLQHLMEYLGSCHLKGLH